MTACQDKAGTYGSTRRAAAWVAENVQASVGAPTVTEGDTSLQF